MADKQYCKHPGCGLRIAGDPEKRTGWSHMDTKAGREADADHAAQGEGAPPAPEEKDPEELRELAEAAHPIAEEPEKERGLPAEAPPQRGKPKPLGDWETVEVVETNEGTQLRIARAYDEAVFRRNRLGTRLLFTLNNGESLRIDKTAEKWFGPGNFGPKKPGEPGLLLEDETEFLAEVERRLDSG